MEKIGIILGYRAPLNTIKNAAIIAEHSNKIDYFFVPETHPKFYGVDAFETVQSLSEVAKKVTLGTGIVNVFSRSGKNILNQGNEILHKTNENFVLGLGTGAPYIIENCFKIKFEKPLTRLLKYTNYLKSHYPGPIFWAAVGDKTIKLAAKHTDGIIFFLKSEDEIKRCTQIIKDELNSNGKSFEKFEIISIRPTILDESFENAERGARISLASHIAGSEFYAKSFSKWGYQNEILKIRESFTNESLESAAEHVSEKLIKEFVTLGGVEECAIDLKEYSKRIEVKSVIAGFLSVHPNENKNINFLKNLERLIPLLEKNTK